MSKQAFLYALLKEIEIAGKYGDVHEATYREITRKIEAEYEQGATDEQVSFNKGLMWAVEHYVKNDRLNRDTTFEKSSNGDTHLFIEGFHEPQLCPECIKPGSLRGKA